MLRDSAKVTYWGGASPGSGKCACGMTNSRAESSLGCNFEKNDRVWREDSGLLTEGGVRVCGIAVLGYFWCGVAVIFVSKYGIAVFRV